MSDTQLPIDKPEYDWKNMQQGICRFLVLFMYIILWWSAIMSFMFMGMSGRIITVLNIGGPL